MVVVPVDSLAAGRSLAAVAHGTLLAGVVGHATAEGSLVAGSLVEEDNLAEDSLAEDSLVGGSLAAGVGHNPVVVHHSPVEADHSFVEGDRSSAVAGNTQAEAVPDSRVEGGYRSKAAVGGKQSFDLVSTT